MVSFYFHSTICMATRITSKIKSQLYWLCLISFHRLMYPIEWNPPKPLALLYLSKSKSFKIWPLTTYFSSLIYPFFPSLYLPPLSYSKWSTVPQLIYHEVPFPIHTQFVKLPPILQNLTQKSVYLLFLSLLSTFP